MLCFALDQVTSEQSHCIIHDCVHACYSRTFTAVKQCFLFLQGETLRTLKVFARTSMMLAIIMN